MTIVLLAAVFGLIGFGFGMFVTAFLLGSRGPK
jgi:hypothetical protein